MALSNMNAFRRKPLEMLFRHCGQSRSAWPVMRKGISTTDGSEETIKKSVFISQSTNVFTNLALEDWFYRNYDFTNHHVLLLWRNDPCVVIGRHQNPWLEANVSDIEKKGIALARRNSGGGTVYHDHGNLNLTFFTPKKRYNRRYNLDIITRALYREWGLKTIVNERDDIVTETGLKVSGTAARLGRPNAYHHCTLLVNAKKSDLSLALKKTEHDIESRASESVRSPIKNLSEINRFVNIEKLLSAIGWEYLRTKALVVEDGGDALIQKQNGFQMINAKEDWFPGINKLRDDFYSWDWIYGRTPEFTVTRVLDVPLKGDKTERLNLVLEVQDGIIEDIKMSLPKDMISNEFNQDASVISNVRGMKYCHGITESIIGAIGGKAVDFRSDLKTDKSNMVATQ